MITKDELAAMIAALESQPHLSIKEEKYLAVCRALNVVYSAVCFGPAYWITYHPNPDENEYDWIEHSHSGPESCARRIATEIGGKVAPVYIGDREEPK